MGHKNYNFKPIKFTWTLIKRREKKLLKNTASIIEQVLAATPHKAPTIRPPASHHENYQS